ncbi:hypothetical protein EsDP_00002787 [Epichloe bromicola]|uniref:Chromatin assembly factor 1 subunit A n=1 Tax=Epichloe bromicola TaxID=79588 RepID=A0ABQ0CLT7_9HYPO
MQEMDSTGRKRSHDEYAGDLLKMDEDADAKIPKVASILPSGDSLPPPRVQSDVQSSSNGFGSPVLTEAGSSTPARNSSSPLTPTKVKSGKPSDGNDTSVTTSPSSTTQSSSLTAHKGPAPKRKHLTAEEKETKKRELVEKRREREEQANKKAAEKARQEEEKAARAKEREEKRKQKEEEDRLRAEQRDKKKRKKEEEQRRIHEEKDRKTRSQQKLNAFFKIPSTPKAEGDGVSGVASPVKDAKPVETEYDKLFKPFFVRDNTRLAHCATQMDQETKDAKSRMLDEFVTRQQDDQGEGQGKIQPFNAMEHLCLPFKHSRRRGKIHHPVKHIMETASSAGGPGGIAEGAREKLARIPQKVLAFSQDVRPPYYGTVTLKPFALGRDTISRLARKPIGRRLPLDYDYDSEAEWQEEEGEDVDLDDGDDEELNDEDDMDGFLDDTEDVGPSRRIFGSVMEPESTGICFENHVRLGPNRTAYEHKMEFMHEGLEHTWGINPWSTEYWEPETKARPAPPMHSTANKMPPPPAPANAFAALTGEAGNAAAAKLVKADLMNDVKQAILDNKALSKVGIIDFIFHRFRDSVSRAEVKNTLEHVAEKKKGAGRSKEWDLKPGHEIVL